MSPMDEEPVIISEKDFEPSPSPSPSPDFAENAIAAAEANERNQPDKKDDANFNDGTDTEPALTEESDTEKESANDDLGLSEKETPDESGAMDGPVEPAPQTEPAEAIELPKLEPVEPEPEPAEPYVPSARQIVSIGTASDSYAFIFHEEELNAILSKIPAGWKVCVVSVVGAFRTGKSFLLSWFLRYLEQISLKRKGIDESKQVDAVEGDASDTVDEKVKSKKWFERVHTINQHDGSFDWRGGTERNTTGIWMWSDPYFLPYKNKNTRNDNDKSENVAVLLVDTQGMFDHETTVGLTAAIFGLSTLLSSYQIYNVDKRIQEDNLQQLALFSEYGRMAFDAEEKAAKEKVAQIEEEKEAADGKNQTESKHIKGKNENSTATKSIPKAPFQKIEFLVRDWQNFDTEDESDLDSMEAEMSSYLSHVLAERTAFDLKETRGQITSCFEEISSFMMTHPGFAVIKNKYEGDVSKIDDLFLRLLDRYCQRVFDTTGSDGQEPRLQPKTVRGRALSAVELGTYIKSYAQMFEEIGAHFPKAETMLEATSKANNTNAVAVSVESYAEEMDKIVGPRANDYYKKEELIVLHKQASKRALMAFDEMANFGSRRAIEEARAKAMEKIEKDYEMYISLNDGRNPLLGFETYILPLFIAAVSYIIRWITDISCSSWSRTCSATSDFLSHLYMVVFFFLAIVACTKAKQISDLIDRIRAAIRVMSGDGGSAGAELSNKKND